MNLLAKLRQPSGTEIVGLRVRPIGIVASQTNRAAHLVPAWVAQLWRSGRKFRAIGLDKGKPWAVDGMADAFRAGFPDIKRLRTEAEWLRVGRRSSSAMPSAEPIAATIDR